MRREDDGGDELYVGYGAAMPPRTARRVRRAIALVAALAIAVPLALVAAQAAFAPASFEFGVVRSFEGTVRERPVPILMLDRPGTAGAEPAVTQVLLVAPGKHGARPDVAGLDGRRVRVAGSLVYREGHTMLEIAPGSVAEAPLAAKGAIAAVPRVPVEDLGTMTLAGEIVDAKCHLGVMNPGEGKTHRGCAARCIAGGIPPILRVESADGESRVLLLVGPRGEPLDREILHLVAEPVRVTGRVERQGGLLVLHADPAHVRRLGEEG
jgi:hypothetical protein